MHLFNSGKNSRYCITVSLLLFSICVFGVSASHALQHEAVTDSKAPILEGMGDHHHPITTVVLLAQRLFDQGLVLSYGFNHKEAERSFRYAVQLDPNCAMGYWEIALVLGPNINVPMPPNEFGGWRQLLMRLPDPSLRSRTGSEDRGIY